MIGTRSGLRAKLGLVGGSVVLALFALLGLAAAPALAERGHLFTGSFGAPGSGPGQLGESAGLAVNEATGNIYYLDKANNRVEIFNANGSKFEGEFNGSGLGIGTMGSGLLLNEGKPAGSGGLPEEVSSGRFNEPAGIAIDNDPSSPSHGDVYVADTRGNMEGVRKAGETPEEERTQGEEARKVVDKFSANGEYIGQISRNVTGAQYSEDGFRFINGVTVDSHGQLWVHENNYGAANAEVAYYTNAVVNTRVGSLSSVNLFSNGDPKAFFNEGFFEGHHSLAVDPSGNIYLTTRTGEHAPWVEQIFEFNLTGEVVNSEVDEENATGVAVESTNSDVYIGHLSNVHRLDATGKSLESLSVPGDGGSNVAVNAARSTVYVADSAGLVDMFGPEAPGAPTVSAGSESVTDVTATSASFSGEVNPRSEPFEEATSYSFEYGPCDTPTTCKSSPYTDSVPVPAGVLAPNYEPDVVESPPVQDLLAHTAYHMRLVAHNSHPSVAEGEELTFTTQSAGAFSLPDGRSWEMVSPPNKYGALIQAKYYVSQASVNGDAITYFANAPIEAQPPSNNDSIVQALSGRGPDGWRSLNISAPHESAPGARTPPEYPFFSSDLSVALLQPSGAFVPSLSSEASEQTPFLRSDFPTGEPDNFCTSSCYTPLVTGAPGFENVPAGTVFGQNRETGGECINQECGPEFVGANPDASHIILGSRWASLAEGVPTGQGQSLYEWTDGHLSYMGIGTLGSGSHEAAIVRNAISADGSRIVGEAGSHLVLYDSGKEETVQLDEVQGGSGEGSVLPTFQAASKDGSRIFFIDSQRLTKDATGPSDLYECEIVEEAGKLKCKLTDLTGGGGESAGVMGTIAGTSEDGAYVYFVAKGVLPGVPANERGEIPIARQPNLYVRHAGDTRLIAVLSEDDSSDWTKGLLTQTTRVSPNGIWFTFMSDRSLTGLNDHDALSGKPDQEVFLYHAGENGEGKLVCASCDPTGSQPHGVASTYETNRQAIGPSEASFGDLWVAGMLPGWTSPFHQSRYLSDSGRLFFDSFDALVPQDTNNAEDAYQFEPVGVGDCSEASATFVVASGGCVGLISSGTSKEASAFLDASESGSDVFFLTAAQLSPQDTDSAIDIYDAHECGAGEDCSPPVPVPVPACEGDACQSPVAAPEDPTPGSLTYQGPGNPPGPLLSAQAKPKSKPVKCKKGSVKQHGKCVKKKSAKRAKKAKRSNRRGK